MGVKMVGVERLLIVVNRQFSIESLQIVGIKDSFRFLPVGIAMGDFVGVAMLIVGHVVEVYVDGIAAQLGDRHAEPVCSGYHLE